MHCCGVLHFVHNWAYHVFAHTFDNLVPAFATKHASLNILLPKLDLSMHFESVFNMQSFPKRSLCYSLPLI